MDYKERIIDILTNKELTSEQKQQLEKIFPELSELDKLMLENQGKQKKPAIIIPKFRVGDTIRVKNSDAEYTITKISDGYYRGKGWCLDVAAGDKSGDYELVKHKPADKVEPKFHEGDWIIRSAEGFKRNTYLVTEVKDYYVCEELKGRRVTFTFNDVHKNFRLWNISDAKDGDVLFMDNGEANCIFIYKSSNNGIINKYASYNKFGFEGEHYLVLNDGYVIPATKEQRDTLEKAMTDTGYTFDFEKKELKKIEKSELTEFEDSVKGMMDAYRDAICANNATIEEVKKHAAYMMSLIHHKPAEWSEEDEKNLSDTILFVKTGTYSLDKEKLIKWIKSLKYIFKQT